MKHLTPVLTLAAVALAASPAAAQNEDTITFTSSKGVSTEKGIVVGLNFKEITWKKDAGGNLITMTEKSRSVMDIEFHPDNTPFEFQNARKLMQDFQFKEAADRFNRVKNSTMTSEPVKEFCRRYIIECHLQAGDLDAAVAAAEQLRKEKPDSFFLKDSFVLQYEAAKGKGDPKLQKETMQKFSDAVKEHSMTEWNRHLDMISADATEASREFEGALKIYTRLAADREDPRLRESANLGILRCLSALNRVQDLKARAQSVIDEFSGKKGAAPKPLLAAYTARGDCHLAEGRVKEALLDYMWGLLALAPKLGEFCREHETVLARAAIASAKYAKQFGAKDGENKTLYLQRSRDLHGELMATYPRTGFRKEVEDALKEAEKAQ